jgi:Zn-dependent M28 family amino/carboxypeptidase
MFRKIRRGEQVPSKEIPGVTVRLDVEVETYKSVSRNVVTVVEGSDPVLRNEYVLICGHHDARGIDDGGIIAGADDNATAAVALMAIGKALLIERPKRSVILAWVTGEEQGMNGSHYFVNNCPVPVEKISACLNMDMIGRNSSDSLFLVGSDLLSSSLDYAIKTANKKSGLNFKFDYTYSNLTHPQRVYFRSDHYPFVRFGIPSVWIFSGFTPDYHTERDIPEAINYTKFLRTTKLVYQAAFEIGNMKELLNLDVNPAVTSRGKQNLAESSLYR